jgi:phosphoglucosamine mutase
MKKYFGTDGIRGRVGTFPITPEFILKLGWAFGKVLSEHEQKKVLIGKDTRVSGYMFESALESGLVAAGIDTIILGPMPTPGVAYLTKTLRAGSGLVISASHNPYYDNGIKFFNAKGCKLSDEIEHRIEYYLEQSMITVASEKIGKASRIQDAAARYIEFCKNVFNVQESLTGLKIVLDCANGATYHIAPKIFNELGASVISLHIEPNGLNINDGAGSLHPETLVNAVKTHQADLGIAFDGDGDRVILVDHTGEVLDGDDILYILSKYYLAQGYVDEGVVGTQMTNYGLEIALKELGVPFVRTKVGDRFVLEKLQQNNWVLGGENSGHILCMDKTSTGDGIIAAIQILNAMFKAQKNLHELKQGMIKYTQVLTNVPFASSSASLLESEAIQSAVKHAETKLNPGRVLLRSSGTEPVVRVMVEGMDADNIQSVSSYLVEAVTKAAS